MYQKTITIKCETPMEALVAYCNSHPNCKGCIFYPIMRRKLGKNSAGVCAHIFTNRKEHYLKRMGYEEV